MVIWLNRFLKDRQEILVLGELALFLAAWGLGFAAAIDDQRERSNAGAENSVADNSSYSGGVFSGPSFSGQRGEFE